jgi:peroxin-3
LPVFCRQAHAIVGVGELDMGNEYMAAMDRVPDLEAFAAVIYSSNLEYELAEGDDEARAANLEQPKKLQQPSFVESDVIAPASQPEGTSAAIGAEAIPLDTDDTAAAAAEANMEKPQGPVDGAFEGAWKKALATEDGLKDVESGKE